MGMSRSGNHAILNWILRQTEGDACFLNCAEGKCNPFATARALHHGLPYSSNHGEFDWERERAGDFAPKQWLIHSYEDAFLGYVCHRDFEEQHDSWVGASQWRYDVLILRDVFNLFASRYQAGLAVVSARTALRIWKQHAREFLGQSRYLKQARVLINYNRWVSERAYRQGVAAQLGLTFTDAGIHCVQGTGGGSSFDGLHYDGRAGQMRVLERWRVYAEDRAFWRLFDAEAIALARQIFGVPEGLAGLI